MSSPRFLVLVLLALGTGPLSAQLVRGRVTDAASSQPLGGALIALADSAGTVVARTVTAPSGRYALFAPSEGRWALRVAAIGYTPRTIANVAAGADRVSVDVALEVRPFELPELVSEASNAACRVDPASAPVIERLLAEAATALGLVEATIDTRRLEFVTESERLRYGQVSSDTVRQAARTRERASWPLTSADTAMLREHGFVHDAGSLAPAIGYTEESGPVYYGPDLHVLVAPWFVGSHCFALQPDRGGDSLVVRFRPYGGADRVDISGELVLDRGSLALRRLRFRYEGLPRWVPPGEAGGEVSFERLQDGLWVTRSWHLRAPIERRRGMLGARQGSALGGWVELRGRVVEIAGGG